MAEPQQVTQFLVKWKQYTQKGEAIFAPLPVRPPLWDILLSQCSTAAIPVSFNGGQNALRSDTKQIKIFKKIAHQQAQFWCTEKL